ncbi:MAG: redox-regulated ATPase YchF [Parvularculales bacterium]
MGFKCGIVGLPNVGKSTLFNALTKTASAQAANYPFCTIEPNVGDVAVPDDRLEALGTLAKSARIVPTRLMFVDIAGLVQGAAKGEGLGNQFLANIREVDAIIHVLRCFEDDDITHVEGRVDPVADAQIVTTELMLADMESLEKRRVVLEKKVRGQDAEAKETLVLVDDALALLREGKPARDAVITPEKQALWQRLQLLTTQPVLYICNVAEEHAATGNNHTQAVTELAQSEGAGALVIAVRTEEELALLDDEEQIEYLAALNLEEPGLMRLIRAGYALLGLITWFTAGPKEARAWTSPSTSLAPQAAGIIHSDFEKSFIRAEIIPYDDYVSLGGYNAARESGKLRLEGKEYVMQDGDVVLFRTGN